MMSEIEQKSTLERISMLKQIEKLKLDAILRLVDSSSTQTRCANLYKVVKEWMFQLKDIKASRERFEGMLKE